jgi:hypothetical protein
MATVAEILASISTRINDDADLYAFINMALRMCAKRLYQMGSSLPVDQMEVDIFAEVEYAAATIAFVESDPDTITDSANKFVTEGFEAGMWITTDDVNNPGPFKISSVAAGVLTIVGDTGVLSAASAGTSITITSVDDWGEVPGDYWGLVENPYIDGETEELAPVPSQRVALAYDLSPGVPAYFKIKGNRLYVIPATSSDITVKADYFAKPSDVNDRDDELPYQGFCDDIIAEAVVMFYAAGAPGKGYIRDFINEQLDSIVGHMDKKGPVEIPEGIDWNASN